MRLNGGKTAQSTKSVTFRLTMLFASVSTIVLLLLGVIVGGLVERHFEELDMELLDGKLELLRHAIGQSGAERESAALSQQLDDALVGHHGLVVVVLAQDGRLLYAHGDAGFPQTLLSAAGTQTAVPMLWTTPDGRSFRGIAAEVRTGPGSAIHSPPAASAVVAVATDIAHHVHFMRAFQIALWSVVGAAALLSGFLGWIAVRRGLAPLRAMRERAADITANRLDQRLSVAAIPVELAEVAETLDGMLARLQVSFRRLEDFSSDIAHELRTPVSNLLTQTQVTLSRSRTAEEYRDVLASNVEEFERLARMIADMLFLAKADNDLSVPNREPVDLRAEVGGLFEFYEALAEESGVQLSVGVAGSSVVSGDRLMLRRAISNLLSNAFRHTPRGGSIAVRIQSTEANVGAEGSAGAAKTSVILSVENSGTTIPPEHLPRLFDRFYRADASRHRLGDGAGLGLAITRSILRAHGGDAGVRSENGLTTFDLRLPA